MGKKKDKSTSKSKSKSGATEDVVEFYNGTNIFTLPNGDTYIGEYCAHRSGIIWREGQGIYQTLDGQIYEGNWKDDKLEDNKEIMVTYQDGTIYNGPLLKNKYNGSGVLTFKNGISFYGEFSGNKPKGDVYVSDLDGKLWHGQADENNAILQPENIFFQNIEKNRGKSKKLLKLLEPEWAPQADIDLLRSNSYVMTDRDWEKIIFAKSTKTNDIIDFTDSPWYQSYLKYKTLRATVLQKVKDHTRLNNEEAKWYMKYAQYKRNMKQKELEKVIRAANEQVDTSLLERYYSPEFAESSKPYSVFYPSYDWYMPPEDEYIPCIPEEQSSIEESVEEVGEEYYIPYVEEECEPEMSMKSERLDVWKSVGAGTDSLYDYLDTVLDTQMPRPCSEL